MIYPAKDLLHQYHGPNQPGMSLLGAETGQVPQYRQSFETTIRGYLGLRRRLEIYSLFSCRMRFQLRVK